MQEIRPDGSRGPLEEFDIKKIVKNLECDSDTSYEVFESKNAGIRAQRRRRLFNEMTPNQRKAWRRSQRGK